MGGKKRAAVGSGSVIVEVCGNSPTKQYETINPNELITKVTVRACRLFHGSHQWFLTFGKNLFSAGQADALDHHWLILETNKGFYCTQFSDDNCYNLIRCPSRAECDLNGLECCNRPRDTSVWTHYSSQRRMKLTKFVDWMKKKTFSPHYKLTSHNCQDYCKSACEAVSYTFSCWQHNFLW